MVAIIVVPGAADGDVSSVSSGVDDSSKVIGKAGVIMEFLGVEPSLGWVFAIAFVSAESEVARSVCRMKAFAVEDVSSVSSGVDVSSFIVRKGAGVIGAWMGAGLS